jgi:hypothetical protein
MIRAAGAAALALTCALAGVRAGEEPVPPGGAAAEPQPGEKPPADKELEARILALVKQLAHEDFDKREAAGKELLKIGRPAKPFLAEASKDKDVERAVRAADLLAQLARIPDPQSIDPNCTNGWMAVQAGTVQIQTFKPAEDLEVETLRFRAARTANTPFQALQVELRAADAKEDAEPLMSRSFEQQWDEDGKTKGVTRYMNWFEVKAKEPVKLEKGKLYRLVFSSEAGKSTPWLVNCFYRDTFKTGEHLVREGAKESSLGKYDLVFQLCSKDAVKLTSAPEKADLDKKELFGLRHDGVDIGKIREAGDDVEEAQGGVL